MQIFIMRHGEAGFSAVSDEQRMLTQHGRVQSKESAAWLGNQISQLDIVLVSPYVRAQQTWYECSPLLPTAKKIIDENTITPYGDSDSVASYLHALISHETPETLLMVSHLPLVGYLCAQLDKSISPPMFPTSAICQIDYDIATQQGRMVRIFSPQK